MTNFTLLRSLTHERLRDYVRERVYQRRLDPPLSPRRHEATTAYLFDAFRATDDGQFQCRVKEICVELIDEIAADGTLDLRKGPDAEALADLVTLAARIDAREAAPRLRQVLESARAPEADGRVLSTELEEWITAALAALQPKGLYSDLWSSLWQQSEPSRWSLGFTGMANSDPIQALDWLPQMARRAEASGGIDLSLLVWGLLNTHEARDLLLRRWTSFDADTRQALEPVLRELGVDLSAASLAETAGYGAMWAHGFNETGRQCRWLAMLVPGLEVVAETL